ncbi:MAG: hypothetical protein CBC79_03395 [Gammaproteobacteria bacterium TMED119]|nr:MAG: hypothetical protein CBC79_03395 [Gammaproteobacteria bacterium TMED119]RCL47296.1 MAG: TIGR04211 family SH3 domain-containing protein [Candidatus Thioglobus sp.]
MQQRSRILPALILTLCACAHSVLAETKYVTDQFEIMLRTGQSVQHEILRQLKSGTQVTVLESNYEYSRVRTASGKEGWVLTRYLIDQPAGRERAVKLQADLELLQNNFDALLAREKNDLQQEIDRLEMLAQKPLTLEKRNQALKTELQQQQQRYQVLLQETEALRTPYKDREWLITGAGVFFAGMVVGMVLVGRRKRRWNQL